MKYHRFLEIITTKYFIFATFLLIVVTIISLITVMVFGFVEIEKLNILVDISFKVIAVLIGALWALNRYYAGRVDFTQLRVDANVNLISKDKFGNQNINQSLLIFRLDIVNTGTTLILPFQQYLIIDAIYLSNEGVEYKTIYRWPISGYHLGRPIEPKSWSAINDAIAVPSDVKAIRIFLELILSNGASWTWHKNFDISKEYSDNG